MCRINKFVDGKIISNIGDMAFTGFAKSTLLKMKHSHRVSKLSTAYNYFAKFDYLFFKYFNK